MTMNVETIKTVIDALLGGCAEPVGETHIDDKKFEIQKAEEELIDWLICDLYQCLKVEDAYWGSGQRAGRRARRYLESLYEDIGERLGKAEEGEDEVD